MHRERYVSPVLALPGRCLIKMEDQSWETATQRRPSTSYSHVQQQVATC